MKKQRISAKERAQCLAWENETWIAGNGAILFDTLSLCIEHAILAHMRAAQRKRKRIAKTWNCGYCGGLLRG